MAAKNRTPPTDQFQPRHHGVPFAVLPTMPKQTGAIGVWRLYSWCASLQTSQQIQTRETVTPTLEKVYVGQVGIGLVGFGAWGKHHAAAAEKAEHGALVAVSAQSTASIAAAQNAHPNCFVTNDYAELLARDDVDLVDVVLPSDLHFEVARAALAAGKHLLLEKPMALSLADCDALVDAARSHGRQLFVGHELRLSSLWSAIKQSIDAGEIGDVAYCLIELWRNPYRQGAGGWRYDLDRVGNWILEEPIHFFDLARWYLEGAGEPVSVYARASSIQPGHPELQDNFTAVMNFAGDAYATVTQTLGGYEHHQTAKIVGTEGALWAHWSGAMDRTRHPTFGLKRRRGETVEIVPIEKITGELFELEDQLALIAASVDAEDASIATDAGVASGKDGRFSVAMCQAASQSVELGETVNIDGGPR